LTRRPAHIALIVAMADNRVIGADGGLPWRIPADLRHFKALTMGKPVVMGRRTFDSIGKPLPGRPNIVVSDSRQAFPDGVEAARDAAAAVAIARRRAAEGGAAEIFIIGGETLYRALLPQADRIYLTEVHEEAAGDTVFPELDASEWQEVAREDRNDIYRTPVSFVTLERRRQASRSASPKT
jgi:dihydrofolate reductase